MNRNKVIIYMTIISILLIISIPTIYNIIKKHNDRLTLVTEKRITEAAKDCYLKDLCRDKKITLKELYNNKYLEKESNPITKEYYNENSYVLVENNKYTFVEIKE